VTIVDTGLDVADGPGSVTIGQFDAAGSYHILATTHGSWTAQTVLPSAIDAADFIGGWRRCARMSSVHPPRKSTVADRSRPAQPLRQAALAGQLVATGRPRRTPLRRRHDDALTAASDDAGVRAKATGVAGSRRTGNRLTFVPRSRLMAATRPSAATARA
jgi:hypothetical protein